VQSRKTMPNLNAMPEVIWDLYGYLSQADFTESRPWHSPYLEVMLWPYDYAPETSLPWPKDWPDLDSPRAFPRGNGYSIFLDGSQEHALIDFLAKRSPNGAVEISGKKWTVAWRPVFPSEPVWRHAFGRID
jgi:hypothetical protein